MAVDSEVVLFDRNPSMFRGNPLTFVACCVTIPVFGFGLVILLVWWLIEKSTRLTITNKRTTLRRGLFSRAETEVMHRDVRNISVRQSFLQRFTECGTIAVSSAGQGDIEIEAHGIAHPFTAKQIIDNHRERERQAK